MYRIQWGMNGSENSGIGVVVHLFMVMWLS